MTPTTIPTEPAHVDELIANAAQADRKEVEVLFAGGMPFDQGVRFSIDTAHEAWTVLNAEGEVMAIYGCSQSAEALDQGNPWMTSVEADRFTPAVIRELITTGRQKIAGWLERWTVLTNAMWPGNQAHVRFNQMMGFTQRTVEARTAGGGPIEVIVFELKRG
ncbi:MAG: hypothetical protein VXW22_02275 [Pseudomonadota bacterium]|nr:hypothetical protein [Pseudomonadota bacterium]